MKGAVLIWLLFVMQCAQAQTNTDAMASIANTKSANVYFRNGRMGLEKSINKPITPAVYDTLYRISPSLYAGKRFNGSKQQSFWGLINANGNPIIPFKFSILNLTNTLAIVGLQENNKIKYGVYSFNGELIINPIYETVNLLGEQLIAAKKKSQTIVFNHTGTKVFQIGADSISLLSQEYLKFHINGKTGITTLNNKISIPCMYQDIKMINDEIWVKKLPDWQIIKGYDTLNLSYENIIDWESNYIVANGGKSWLINHENAIISNLYDTIIKVNSSLALIKNNAKWGVINIYGEKIIEADYAKIINDDEIIYARSFGDQPKWSLFDFYGFRKTKLRYDAVKPISEGRIGIKRKSKWGFIDRYGIETISPIFDKVSSFKNGLAIVTIFGEDGIINSDGNWIVAPSPIKIIGFDNNTLLGRVNSQYQIKHFNGELIYFSSMQLAMGSGGFTEQDSSGTVIRYISWTGTFVDNNYRSEKTMTGGAGLVIFKANGKYGFKDQQRRIIIANRYEAVKPFHQRLAAVKLNHKWGFINLDEQLIIQPRYDSVGYFSANTCITQKLGLLGAVNLNGEEIIANQYQQIIALGTGQFKVQKGGYWGVLDEKGAVVIHPKYNHLVAINQSFYIAERNGKYGTLDMNGVNKIPLLFDFIAYNNSSKTLVTKQGYKNKWAFLQKTHSFNN